MSTVIKCFGKLAALSSMSLFACCPFQFQVWRNVEKFCIIQQNYVCVSNFVQTANCHLMFCQAQSQCHSSPVVHSNFKCGGMWLHALSWTQWQWWWRMTGNRNIVGNYFNLQEQLSVKVFPGDEDKISEVEEELTGRQKKNLCMSVWYVTSVLVT